MAKKTIKCRTCGGSGTETLYDNAAIGFEMRSLREAANLSRAHVAAGMNVTPQHVYDLERGNRNWNSDLEGRFRAACSTQRKDKKP